MKCPHCGKEINIKRDVLDVASKPWEREGISRSTYYQQRKIAAEATKLAKDSKS